MKNNQTTSLFPKEQVMESLKQSFVKLNPRVMIKNPIMFMVEVCSVIMFAVMIYSIFNDEQGSFAYNTCVFVILFITLLFANFAEAIAETRGKAQADSLRKTREETPAKRIVDGKIQHVSSSQLKKGDVFECEAGDVIPCYHGGIRSRYPGGRRGQKFRDRRYESVVRPYQGTGYHPTGRELP